ncbi:MAG: homoserine kinase, partial [Sphingomonadales bacterium]|nr:homoserine kinase [Sphingomonadales bacterium]
MAVHTALEHAAVARFLERYSLGRLTALTGIEQGI